MMSGVSKNLIGVHHGAREIEIKTLIQDIPGLAKLSHTIRQFREVAYSYNKNASQDSFLKNERFNNNISIMGSRGMGKSSVLISTMREISTMRLYDLDKEPGINTIDIINNLIDPEDIGDNSDIIGWTIMALSEQIDALQSNCIASLDDYFCDYHQKYEELVSKKEELISYYAFYGVEYSSVALSKSINRHEFSKNFSEVLLCDYKLHKCFIELIDLLISFKRNINSSHNQSLSGVDIEPLIYFFFDDLDMFSAKSINILTEMLSFFYHPNIVIFISGDYEVFEQSVVTHFLKETKEVTLKMTNDKNIDEVQFAYDRAEYFLKKVLPPSYRLYIQEATSESIKMDYLYRASGDNIFEKMNVFQLLTYIFYTGFERQIEHPENYYLNFLIVPQIDSDNKNIIDNRKYPNSDINQYVTEDKAEHHLNFLYSYLSVFSINRRGFMNLYNYLCKEAKHISESSASRKQYWEMNQLSEFFQTIINSKHTYVKYESFIKSFMSIKIGQKSTSVNNYTKLSIDCEELELFISGLVTQVKRLIENKIKGIQSNADEKIEILKKEITSLIMLPTLMNELFYIIQEESYAQRHERIQTKLKAILTNVFINSLNDEILILPTKLNLQQTLCVLYQIESKMSLVSLSQLENKYNKGYANSNNKKYIVQLYYATINLGSSMTQANTQSIFKENDYTNYKNSTYSNFTERKQFEQKIAKNMNQIFRHLDREWLADKINFSVTLEPTIFKIEYNTHLRFSNLLYSLPLQQIYSDLDELNRMICIQNEHISYFNDSNENWIDYYIDLLFNEVNRMPTLQKRDNLTKEIIDIIDEMKESSHFDCDQDQLQKMKEICQDGQDRYNQNTKSIELLQSVREINNSSTKERNYTAELTKKIDDLKKCEAIEKYSLNDFSLYRNFENILESLSSYNIDDKKAEYYHGFFAEISSRQKNLSTDNAQEIKKVLNELDDFKTNFEVLISRFSSMLEDVYDLEAVLLDKLEDGIKENNFDLTVTEDNFNLIIDQYIYDLLLYCRARDRMNVKMTIQNLILDLNKEKYISSDFLSLDQNRFIDNLATAVLRYTRDFERASSLEFKRLESILSFFTKMYYIYSFILDAVQVYNDPDTIFFGEFKKNISYDHGGEEN